MATHPSHPALGILPTPQGPVQYYRLAYLEEQGWTRLERLPFSIRVLLESLVRLHLTQPELCSQDDLAQAARWDAARPSGRDIPFLPARVLMQDFTGVPAVVDLAAMRAAMARKGGDPKRINPLLPVDLVIDHSVQVDIFAHPEAFAFNVEREYERNRERYAFLRWAQQAFQNFRVVPPGTGICHQVNLEYLSSVVALRPVQGRPTALPDTVLGTDSHTTMVNGLGVLGWGVGGIEAEAVMLGQPYFMLMPPVVGVKLLGRLPQGATATDLVLTVTELLRKKGVVDKFVEFFGPGLDALTVEDRATIANMSPEYGATCGFFPVDAMTLRYLRGTGRDEAQIALVERYCRAQGLFRDASTPDPVYSETLTLDLSQVVPSLAGPSRPQDRIPLTEVKRTFHIALEKTYKKPAPASVPVRLNGHQVNLSHGSVVIAAITSCTNTSNPSVMVGAGLLAKKAVERGLRRQPWVKTSMAPGSRVVTDYLERAGLLPYLEALGFHVVGYGCTTCIGNSGPLPDPIAHAITAHDLVVAAVLSGNRNFEARIHPQVRANFLASPMLVVAYALVGRMDVDLTREPLGHDTQGRPVFLQDIWPSPEEIAHTVASALSPEAFRQRYSQVFEGDHRWKGLPVPAGDLYAWDATSTYIQEAPFFLDLPTDPPPLRDIRNARVLVMLGDSITTDHISPAGSISPKSPAGQYLISKGVPPAEFNTFGARRGNHEVMVRGTFGNIRLKNLLVPGTEGDWTVHFPSGQQMRIFEASQRYQKEGVPLLVLAGKEYGSGSSRDWAAKGPALLGIKAVIAESYERIHRSNLVGMGILPLQFRPGESAQTLGLTGTEVYHILGLSDALRPHQELTVRVQKDGQERTFTVIARVDTPVEVGYLRHGGVLNMVLRRLLKEDKG
ncbi:MAG: aconitate hydratase AcnA [Dehalococcoidia bacterium]|nr:aconitate hydratase AcnA [Dehalococcoidia bacterium]MDW8120498.1 aconitate hydratase AcnA [Chloroflexota bacterium]